ncbi:MAG: hypothetical protein ACJ749_04330 [Flavisolibacter sp.]
MNFSILIENSFMKGSRSQNTRQNKTTPGHRPMPQNKDDLDSRKNEEQDTKGDDVTHNEKQVRGDNRMRKGKEEH